MPCYKICAKLELASCASEKRESHLVLLSSERANIGILPFPSLWPPYNFSWVPHTSERREKKDSHLFPQRHFEYGGTLG